ncbi:MAG: ATP-binding protein [Blastocatellia bacterium]|nr:ATP-binding protein [Blastocatellia bacterium]
MKSPFTIGPKIENSEDFIGRKAEVNHILTRLRTMQSCSIVGERRIGKSSLLYYVSQTGGQWLSDENYRFLYLELTDACTQTLVDFLRTILQQLNCPTDGIKDDNRPSRNLIAFDKEIVALKEIGEQIVLCLDEFEALFENVQEFNNAFFNHFRTMVNHRRLALVTASKQPLEVYSLEKKLTSPFFNVFSITELGNFTEEEALHFIAIAHTQVNFSEDELQFINSYFDPHPIKLQILCEQMMQNRERRWRDQLLLEEIATVYRQFLGGKYEVKSLGRQIKGKITLDAVSKLLGTVKTTRDLLTGK